MSNNNRINGSNNDHLVTCGGLFITGIILHLLHDKWKRIKEKALLEDAKTQNMEDAISGDHYHHVRYHTAIREQKNLAVHFGQCHCSKVQFKILAPRVIYAVDIPSKIRFPRVTVNYVDFELLHTDVSVLSMYTVQQTESSSVGIHSFCSYCGMQVLYAPSIDPIEVQVNLDCLDAGTIEATHIAYHSSLETAPYPHIEEFNKRGEGFWTQSPILHELGAAHSPRPSPSQSSNFEARSVGTNPKTTYFVRIKEETGVRSETSTEPLYTNEMHQGTPIMESLSRSNKPFMNKENEKGGVDDLELDAMSVTSMDSMDPRASFYLRPPSAISMISDEESFTNSSYYSLGRSERPNSFSGVSALTDSNNPSPATVYHRKRYHRHSSSGNSSTIDFGAYQQMKRFMHRHMSSEIKSPLKRSVTIKVDQQPSQSI